MYIYFTKYIPAPEAETKIRKMIIVFQKYLKFEVCRNRCKITYVQDLHGKKIIKYYQMIKKDLNK